MQSDNRRIADCWNENENKKKRARRPVCSESLGGLGVLDVEANSGAVVGDLHQAHLGPFPAVLRDGDDGLHVGVVVRTLVGAVDARVSIALCLNDVAHFYISLLWSVVRDVRATPEGGGIIPLFVQFSRSSASKSVMSCSCSLSIHVPYQSSSVHTSPSVSTTETPSSTLV